MIYFLCEDCAVEEGRVEAAGGQIQKPKMYGLIGKMIAIEGKREQLASILIKGVSGMPGCMTNDMGRVEITRVHFPNE